MYYNDEDYMEIDEVHEFLKWLEEYERVGPDLSCPWVGLSRAWYCWHGVNAGTEAAAAVYQRLLAGAVSTSLHAPWSLLPPSLCPSAEEYNYGCGASTSSAWMASSSPRAIARRRTPT